MRLRNQLRVADLQPEPQRRFYCHKPERKPVSRTIAHVQNPWHEGMAEAKRSGARHSRGECLFPAKHSTERFEDVATDRRIRAKAEADRKEADRKKVMYRRWGLDV